MGDNVMTRIANHVRRVSALAWVELLLLLALTRCTDQPVQPALRTPEARLEPQPGGLYCT